MKNDQIERTIINKTSVKTNRIHFCFENSNKKSVFRFIGWMNWLNEIRKKHKFFAFAVCLNCSSAELTIFGIPIANALCEVAIEFEIFFNFCPVVSHDLLGLAVNYLYRCNLWWVTRKSSSFWSSQRGFRLKKPIRLPGSRWIYPRL